MPDSPSDDDIIDFGKWFKKKEQKTTEPAHISIPTERLSSSSDEELSFKGLGGLFQRKKTHPSSDDASLDINFTKHARWLVPLLLIIIVFSITFHFRSVAFSLPVAQEWADNSVSSFYRDQIGGQVSKQFPNLPASNKKNLVDTEFQKFRDQNKDLITNQVAGQAEQLRSQFRDSTGQVYLLGIDPYYYFRQTRNILQYGTVGTEVRDGKAFDGYKTAPVGSYIDSNLHPYIGALLYKIMSLFSSVSLMGSFIYVGALISALSIIPAFFIGRKVGGNVGGLFAAWGIGLNLFFVSRTAGESSDTDAYNIFFPVLIVWIFLEALDQKDWKKRVGLSALTGALVGLYAFAWTGWWFVLYFMLATLAVVGVYYIILNYYHHQSFSSCLPHLQQLGTIFVVLFVSAFIFTTIFAGFDAFDKAIRGPLGFILIKSVGTTKIWPNVLTTVAELNPSSLSSVVGQLGGAFLLFLVIVGIVLTFTKKDIHGHYDVKYLALFGLWLAATLWSTTKGVRFTLLVVPAIGLGFGFFCGVVYQSLSRWIVDGLKANKLFTRTVLVFILFLLIIQPTRDAYAQGVHAVPAMNDGWWDSLTKIKDNSKPNAIITSWWDFGHWFKAIADRPVTFDGGSQNTPQAHWVGKLLLTDNEQVSVGILRMLDCGGNSAFDEVNKKINDIRRSVAIINRIVVQGREDAAKMLGEFGFTPEERENVLHYTHCTPPEGFVIASDDMIGKSGVWAHFGAWDFDRAAMVFKTQKLPHDEAISILVDEFNLSSDRAEKTYQDILTEDSNKWIAPWPSYNSGAQSCVSTNDTITCKIRVQQGDIPLIINRSSFESYLPTRDGGKSFVESVVFATPEDVSIRTFNDSHRTGFSTILVPTDGHATDFNVLLSDPLLAGSMFTRMFFYQGHGLRCFTPFDARRQVTGGMVYTYKVDWNCAGKNRSYFTSPPTPEAKKDTSSSNTLPSETKSNGTSLNTSGVSMGTSRTSGNSSGNSLTPLKTSENTSNSTSAPFKMTVTQQE